MKKTLFVGILLSIGVLSLHAQLQEGLTQYKLENGLTVYLWEDQDAPDVTGYVVTRAGSIDEPAEYTGLAHYLEHMLFKGTEEIGALDWEKEKPLYEEIIKLYDEFSDSTDPAVREELTKKINEVSREAAKYTATDDFSNLIAGMGGEGLNAFTSYDLTAYFNSFPAYQMEKWLTIYADRLVNPVFRSFQAELENVFEEYNMYQDYPSEHVTNFLYSHLYEGHPYERDVIGTPEHLKNPRLSRLIAFYNTWYVPNNMALLLVGNFNAEETKPLIEKTFGKLESKPLPERTVYPEVSFAGNPKYNTKAGYYPQIVWGFKGVKRGHEDEIALDFVVHLLTNSMSTGLLDKLTMDGIVSYAGANMDARRDQGRILVMAVPYFDINQRQYESNKATEKIIAAEIEKLKNGNIEDWLIESVKENYNQSYALMLESSSAKTNILMDAFVYQLPLEDQFTDIDKINALTKEDIIRIAKKYFDADYITLAIEEGTPKKNKLKKPNIQPLEPPTNVETDYAKMFKQLPTGTVKETYNNFADVQKVQLDEQVNLYYTPNPKNDIFTLTMRYGVGAEQMPMLPYAVSLLENAGIMPNIDAQQFRRQLSELGGRCGYACNENYLYVQIVGKDANLEKICELVNRQMLMPKLDKQQLDNIKGSEFSSRLNESKQSSAQANALLAYALYGNKSPYLDRVSFMDVYNLSIPQLHGYFSEAKQYALDAHYVGTRSLDDVKSVLALTEGMKPTKSPFVRERVTYSKGTIYFLPNTEMQQAKVYFYINGKPYDIKQDVSREAFNQYFSGGFSGLVMNEIREKRSMAYTAYGADVTPDLQGKDAYFIGYVGTQSDKVADAIDVYMDLLTNMPEYADRVDDIKTYLKQSSLTSKPSFRSKSQVFAEWQRIGYTDDPARLNMPGIENLSFEQILDFYKENIQGKPITIVIMGDPKLINLKQIQANHGKVTKLSKSKLFSPLDLDF
ncbi:MAG: insulinase family protein [Paludibacter sp.]|nr:insulinase family protein [Bacteroidales bacterium]MCM1068864.1 insulinase family protein [Prevotella sp.]MCM1353125.1 insulinase family protein [Bacteroides sp.]MCM1442447.1 insulinase family protein [Muribaculum sp.]MCM1481290.1 insulinase family protein [Paludibacter sp.]